MSRKPQPKPADPKGRGHSGKGEKYNPKQYDARNFHNGHPRGGCKACGGK